MLVTAGQASTSITVTRGQRGTTAATHSNGATVTMDGGQTSVQMNGASGPANGSCNLVGLYNAYNRISFPVLETDSESNGSATWTYTSQAWRQAHGTACNEIIVLDGLGQMFVTGVYQVVNANNTAGDGCTIGIGQNETTNAGIQFGHFASTSTLADNRGSGATSQTFTPALGLSYYAPLEYVNSGGTCTTYPPYLQFSFESTVND
jgi:hypothetical protein